MTVRELPQGFVVEVRPEVRRPTRDLMVGGSPLRVVRLSPRARALVEGGRVVVRDGASATLARRLLDGGLADPVVGDAPEPQALDSELTVVVPVRDRVAELDRCLGAVGALPVIVVDDASCDAAAVERVAHRHRARYLRLTSNRGPAGARMAGLAVVDTPLVAFVDSDVTVTAEALVALAGHCRDPQVALVGPRVVGTMGPESSGRWFQRYDVAASSLDLGPAGGLVRPATPIGWLPSACLVGRVADLGQGFDPELRVAEDVDLVWRLVAAGWSVRYDAEIRAHHQVRPTLLSWLGRKVLYGTGAAELEARHPRQAAPAVLTLPAALGAAVVLLRGRGSLSGATAATLWIGAGLHRRLPPDARAPGELARLSLTALGWALRQESALLLRHWWPLTLAAATGSATVRRMVVSALLVDAADALVRRPVEPEVGVAATLLGRRLDDLAYGTGLWWGVLRRRRVTCLLPRWVRPAGTVAGAQVAGTGTGAAAAGVSDVSASRS